MINGKSELLELIRAQSDQLKEVIIETCLKWMAPDTRKRVILNSLDWIDTNLADIEEKVKDLRSPIREPFNPCEDCELECTGHPLCIEKRPEVKGLKPGDKVRVINADLNDRALGYNNGHSFVVFEIDEDIVIDQYGMTFYEWQLEVIE